VREAEAIIGKAPRLGIHTRVMQTPAERNIWGTEVNKNFMEGVCVGWRVREVGVGMSR